MTEELKSTVPEALKLHLSPTQQSIVNHNDGALLVVAGPGSGKTRVLTERVRRLLNEVTGHFRILALTFTNKAANEMQERLKDLGNLRQRAFIGTLHGFCLELLTDRGAAVGVTGIPNIFERYQDKKQILIEAIQADPDLLERLTARGDAKDRERQIDTWLRAISYAKSHPVSFEADEPFEARLIEAYNAGLRASNAYDFEDLLALSYKLLAENPKIADFYRRLYKFICIDEAQDLNEVQYCVLKALCGNEFRNVMMVGDPKQSIYGFNTSSPKYMEAFEMEFGAKKIVMHENFRSSRLIVALAKALEPTYSVEGQLPLEGEIGYFQASDEDGEADYVARGLQRLFVEGHPDIEGPITPRRCAVLGRNRFTLLKVEQALRNQQIDFYKRLSAAHENESALVEAFQLALRVYANPFDKFHLQKLCNEWDVTLDHAPAPSTSVFDRFANSVKGLVPENKECLAVVNAVSAVQKQTRLDLLAGLRVLREHADTLEVEDDRRAVYEDTVVLEKEWDQYLRTQSGERTISGYLSAIALGTTQQVTQDGVALLTVHSSKGLEFDVVFLVGLTEGVFPDYRSTNDPKALAEENRNAFVAVTRSKRVLNLSYPQLRMMPWGDLKRQQPSRYLLIARDALTKAKS